MKLKELTDKNWNNFFTPLRDDYEIVIIQYYKTTESYLGSRTVGNYYLAYKKDDKYFLLTNNIKPNNHNDYVIKVNADSRFKEYAIKGWFFSSARNSIVPVFCVDNYNRELVDNRALSCDVEDKWFISFKNLSSYNETKFSLGRFKGFIINSIEYHFDKKIKYKMDFNILYDTRKSSFTNIAQFINAIENYFITQKGIEIHEQIAVDINESKKIVNSCDTILSINKTHQKLINTTIVYPYDYTEIKPELYHMINDGVMSINDALLISKNNIPIINYQQNPTLSGITVCTYFPLDKNNLPTKIFIDYVYPLDRDINIIKRLNDLFGKSSNNDLNLLFLLL